MKEVYTETISLIERLHRHFLDVIKVELERLKIDDVNNVQTLMMVNIGDEQLTIGELTNRGYYLGSNVSYNVKKLVENDYLIQEQAPHDKRSVRIRLSEKALALCTQIDDLYERNVKTIEEIEPKIEALKATNTTLGQLEEFWTKYIAYPNRYS